MKHTSEVASFLRSVVVCPVCKSPLDLAAERIACTSCGRTFPQAQAGVISLMPSYDPLAEPHAESVRRQTEMESWYDDLLSDSVAAAASLEHDYRPFSEIFSQLSGVILDLGGGVGLPRQFLPDDSGYVVLDPSLTWLEPKWLSLAASFPCVRTPPPFVQGVGEFIPFAEGSVDAVLACWSLNHVTDPEQVLQEISRVLRIEGRCVLILEDMIPGYRDVAGRVLGAVRRGYWSAALEHARHLLPSVRRAWPLQSDHIRVTEAQISAWTAPRLRVVRRSWIGGYLTLELAKNAGPKGWTVFGTHANSRFTRVSAAR